MSSYVLFNVREVNSVNQHIKMQLHTSSRCSRMASAQHSFFVTWRVRFTKLALQVHFSSVEMRGNNTLYVPTLWLQKVMRAGLKITGDKVYGF